MGMEMAELVMDLEDKFKIYIQISDVFTTVGELEACLIKKLAAKPKLDACPTPVIALRLRHALMQATGLERKEIRFSSRLQDILSCAKEPDAWSLLADNLGCTLPRLRFQKRIITIYWSLVAATVIATPIIINPVWLIALGIFLWIILIPIVLIALWALVLLISGARPVVLPENLQTFQDLLNFLTKTKKEYFISTQTPLSEQQVHNQLYEIIAKYADRPMHEISSQHTLHRDLGLG